MIIRPSIWVLLFLVVATAIALIWFNIQKKEVPSPPVTIAPRPTVTPVARQPVLPASKEEPKLFKDSRYPPQTLDEKAMWDWWNRMNKQDQNFQWKRPISFYGKVIDQYGQPVAGAKVKFQWTNISVAGTAIAETISGDNGMFSLTGVRGKNLGATVYKYGYLSWPKSSNQGFEYAAFSDPNFYVPDQSNPVLFKLWKINPNADPLIWRHDGYKIQNNKIRYLNLKTGEMVYSDNPTGDLGIQISSSTPNFEAKFNYTINIMAPNGGGMAESSDDFMVQPPNTGYQSSFEITQDANATVFNRGVSKKFYLKTGDGKYAAVNLIVSINNDGSGGQVQISYYYNPSGSKNLESDPAKEINQ